MSQNHSTAIDDTEIRYDRTTKDYVVLVAGRPIGWAPSYHEAEQKRTAFLRERMEDERQNTTCATCGGEGDCPDCDGGGVPYPYLASDEFRAELRQAVNEAFEPLHAALASWSTGVAR